ncbi:hypothetical protein [Mycobacterium sp. E2733]|uniref:hypothetical protein n=1 Tax=Mycobacterium sp. E2733 TaxID=1834138 RepID=UPI000B07DFE8|nr:hypothetical protein [Mycobacterium sp. E2733]
MVAGGAAGTRTVLPAVKIRTVLPRNWLPGTTAYRSSNGMATTFVGGLKHLPIRHSLK